MVLAGAGMDRSLMSYEGVDRAVDRSGVRLPLVIDEVHRLGEINKAIPNLNLVYSFVDCRRSSHDKFLPWLGN